MGKKKGKKKDRHHIWPKGRFPEMAEDDDNIVWIDAELHRRFHLLHEDSTPHEVLDFLVEYFWGGQLIHVETYLKQKRESEEITFQHFI